MSVNEEQEKAEKFFSKVKGKKIRYSNWKDEEYYIPEELEGCIMKGKFYTSYGTVIEKSTWMVKQGFNIDVWGGCWDFIDKADKTKCVCEINSLMAFGCTCGGK